MYMLFFFFFSSRRRHTRWTGDWSSDVCSSDLISELANKPLRIEDRVKKSDDGAGGVMDQTVKFPVWFDPYSKGGTPMCAALKEATKITETWCQEHPNGFPPIVINITDGEATDGDLVAE